MDTSVDLWDQACELLARRATQRVARQISPPSDEWGAWCREMERRQESLSHVYFPSDAAGIVFSVPGDRGFSYETKEQTAWRKASNRMKRAADLWKQHADSLVDSWGRWCTARGMNQAAGRIPRNDFLSE